MALLAAMLCALPALAHPGSAIVIDRGGQVWFLDTGDGLWGIDRKGALVRVGGDRFHWMAFDAEGRFRSASLPRDVKREPDNPALLIASDFPIAVGRDGALYYPSPGPDHRVRIMRLASGGTATVLATLPATNAAGQPLRWINGLAAGADGRVYVTDNHSVLRVTAQGRVEAVARGIRVPGCRSIPGNAASEGPLLRGLAVDAAGVVTVAASGCGSLLRITPQGRVSKLLQLESPWSPTAVALFGTDVYVQEYLHTELEDRRAWIPRVRKLGADGKSQVLARVAR